MVFIVLVTLPTGGELVGLSLGINDGESDSCDEGVSDGTVEKLSLS